MNRSMSVRRPRASDMLEYQLESFVPAVRRARRGSSLARLVTVLMLTAVGIFVVAGLARSDEVPDDDTETGAIGAGTLLFRSATGNAPAPLLDTDVQIKVSGMVSRVTVRQQFHNPGAEFVEGLYLFPLPDDSAVDTLTMRIGQRLIVGEIQEKLEARRTYTQARESGQRASLVEQKRPNMFTTAVANIGPGENIEIEIGYLQTMSYRQGEFSLRFPMTITPRFEPPVLAATNPSVVPAVVTATDPAIERGVTEQAVYQLCDVPRAGCSTAELNVELDAGFPLARIESLYHDMDVVQAGYKYRLQPVDGPVPMDRDFELVWQPALGAQPEAAVFTETWKGEAFAMIMLLPPVATGVPTGQPREVLLVIDTSGSMGGTSIRQARDALRFALGRLKPRDRFNVIRFDSSAAALFRQSMPADPGSVATALRFVDSLSADGGTNIGAALNLALDQQADQRATADGFLRQVVFITDGSVGNEHELFAHIESKLGQTRLFTVGIGSAPNDWFMRKAAQFGRGTFTHIGADHMIEERMEKLLARLESPVLQNIEIDAPAGAEIWPERIQDLYAGQPVLVRARLSAPGGTFRVHANDAYSPWQRSLTLTPARNNEGVAALWGRSRIEALLDSVVTGADADVVRESVIKLALKHHLVSRYTSLVAVDHTPVRAIGTPLNEQRVALNAPHGSAMLGYPAGATPMAMLAWGGLLTLLLALALALTGKVRRRALSAGLRELHNGKLDNGGAGYWNWL